MAVPNDWEIPALTWSLSKKSGGKYFVSDGKSLRLEIFGGSEILNCDRDNIGTWSLGNCRDCYIGGFVGWMQGPRTRGPELKHSSAMFIHYDAGCFGIQITSDVFRRHEIDVLQTPDYRRNRDEKSSRAKIKMLPGRIFMRHFANKPNAL